ncbi:SDR family NAD(P)-dependent oxidoreductase [Actinomycetospora termitidis]|uniref:SDR family NAD(P)-dependent oxidoreductase n=1 Tax=Actinomycetospora termitidis TaxID=3053470 RepID=A0ABT7MK03_9PSEU|nr:SDR family NAD(P)-dependent oxidoreductase [Actinomycetospora sp. Odt1-22]MDL5159688.1 SDR family NAD(P)-dependent oxidoreductase [Actinomycetospora sp. Odt1-22]
MTISPVASSALVTGASSGIGAAFARALAERGRPLVLVARSEEALRRLAESLPVPVRVSVADLTVPEDLARVEALLGEVGLLVNNAGATTFAGLGGQSPAELDASVLLNVLAPTRLTAAALRSMAPGSGIINVSSTAAGRDDPALATYAAGKAYLESFSRAARHEAVERRIALTVVRPGRTRTAFHQRAGEESAHLPASRWQTAATVVRAALTAHERGEDEVTIAPGRPAPTTAHLADPGVRLVHDGTPSSRGRDSRASVRPAMRCRDR